MTKLPTTRGSRKPTPTQLASRSGASSGCWTRRWRNRNNAFVKLSSGRVCLRRWRDEDREAFAAMNSDARVMEFFRSPLSRVESDAMVDRIQKNFSEHNFGLWAIEIPGVTPFIGFAGLCVARFSAHFTPCVEVGW